MLLEFKHEIEQGNKTRETGEKNLASITNRDNLTRYSLFYLYFLYIVAVVVIFSFTITLRRHSCPTLHSSFQFITEHCTHEPYILRY